MEICKLCHRVVGQERNRGTLDYKTEYFAMSQQTGKDRMLCHSLFAEVIDGLPVVLMHSKPFTIAWSNVDVHRTEVVVFLMA